MEYIVVISDEKEALFAAKAAGRVFVGLSESWMPGAEYLVESLEAVDERYLERVVRRSLGLPWTIARTNRLLIREFVLADVEWMRREAAAAGKAGAPEGIFCGYETMEAYIRNQYRFYEYGVWAVVNQENGELAGYAGVTGQEPGLELGYYIAASCRRRGYAREACQAILSYVQAEYACPVYAVTEASNKASVRLLCRLGFRPVQGKEADRIRKQRCSEAMPQPVLYAGSC